MNKPIRMLALACAVLFLALSGEGSSQVKVPVQYFIDLLNQGKYDVVYDSIQRFRNKVSYGKSPTLDFLEAKCLCLNGTCQNAYSLFAKIFQCYHLSEQDKEFLVKEIGDCQTPSTQVTSLAPHGDAVRLLVAGEHELLADVTKAAVAELGLAPGRQVWLSVKETAVESYEAEARVD